MKHLYIKALSIILIVTFSLSCSGLLAEAADSERYDIESAVQTGLKNSILLEQLEDRITLNDLKYEAYKEIGSDLVHGNTDLNSGESGIEDALSTISSSQSLLNNAKIDILNGYYPKNFPDYTVIEKTQLPNGIILPALVIISDYDSDNSDRKTILEQFTKYSTENGTLLAAIGKSFDPKDSAEEFIANLKRTVKEKQAALDEGKIDYEEGLLSLVDGKIDYATAKSNISSSLAEKLDMSELTKLTAAQDKNLLLKLTEALATVTVASKGIYRNQIALQIQNSYYNVMKAQKLLDVKESTMKRAETQYQFAKDGYETGMKAKDGMLLAEIFLTGTKLEYQKARDDYENAMIELKKNMNIPLDKRITLEEASMNENMAMELDEGLEQGLSGRLEIIKAQQQIDIYDMNLSVVKSRYNSKSTQYKEALKLKNTMSLELKKARNDVESSIRQSYNTMKTMESMLETSKDMVTKAEECVEIARSKYMEGFGSESSLLDKLGLGASTGTILEVISAEENLTQVEEKYIEILYGYNLAKAKYLNDIAYLTY